jgi:ATP-binding cassette subfamily C (CFTR/MRP) protein 1
MLSSIYITWMPPVLAVGHRRNLKSNNISAVTPNYKCKVLCDAFEHNFQRQRLIKFTRPLLMALPTTLRRDFGRMEFISSPPPLMGRGDPSLLGILFMQYLQSVTTSQFQYHGAMVGAQAYGLLETTVFRNSLKLYFGARAAVQGYLDGRIIDFLATDVARIECEAENLHIIWAAPFAITACLVFLIINIGYAVVRSRFRCPGGLCTFSHHRK